MKINFPQVRQLCFLFISAIIFVPAARAQKNGILPLTGMRFYNEGIAAKAIDVKIDGAQLLSNRIPLNKEIEISLKQATGFSADISKNMFAGAEVIVLSPRGEILMKNPNVFLKSYANGFTIKDLNAFNIKFGIGSELVKGNLSGLLKVRLFDMKGKSQLRLEIPVSFSKPGEALQVSKTVKPIKSDIGVNAMINGLEAKDLLVIIDTSIRVAPKMAYTSMNISNITGSSISGIFEGKESFWVYDNDLNEVKITDILLKKVKGALENDLVDYTLKIPYRLKTNNTKTYFVRFRWESPDKKQLIDVVVNI